jgi:ferritin
MPAERVVDGINEQIKNELYSGYMYLSMAAYCEELHLPGFGHWFRKQAAEELEHGLKLFEYLLDRGARVVLQAIDQPPTTWESPADAFAKTYKHEKKVTALIYKLYETAREENDYATQSMLQWFIDEQVEEEKTASLIVEQLKMAGNGGHSLLMMDHALSKR